MPRTWDLSNPPELPPLASDIEKWTWAYKEYRKHRSSEFGWCRYLLCAETWPCFGHKIALRALIDACTLEQPHQPLPGPPRVVATTTCRWCGEKIWLHSLWGWLHGERGFILCVGAGEGSPPLCGAEALN